MSSDLPDMVIGVSFLPCYQCGQYFEATIGFEISEKGMITCAKCQDKNTEENNDE